MNIFKKPPSKHFLKRHICVFNHSGKLCILVSWAEAS